MNIKKIAFFPLYLVKKWRINKQKRFFETERIELLHRFADALNEAGIVFWLEFGTLLGYYREHGFIAHDCDIDTGTYLNNRDIVYKSLTDAGFELVREYHVVDDGGIEECYQYKHTTIDVFYFRKDGNVLFCNSFVPMKHMFLPFYRNVKCPFQVKRIEVPNTGYQKTVFQGCQVYVPSDCETYLIAHYGKSFMVPNPDYNWKKDSTNIKLYPFGEKPGFGILKSLYF